MDGTREEGDFARTVFFRADEEFLKCVQIDKKDDEAERIQKRENM